MTAAEQLVGTTKAAILRVLLEAPDDQPSVSELARRASISKSAASSAVHVLIAAQLVHTSPRRRGAELRIRLQPDRAPFVRDLLALDEVATAAPTPGHWVAVDASGGIIATDADPKRLVVRLRAQGTRVDGVFRSGTPDDSEPGGHGRL